MTVIENTHTVIVIMAGGSGERFWPLSNRKRPKQLLKLHGDKTLLEEAFDRATNLVPANQVYIVAGELLCDAIEATLPQLPKTNYIAEPVAKNTAACLGLAACHLESIAGPDAVMGVLTSDHLIEEGPNFYNAVSSAVDHASQHPDLVTIGIKPTHPHTGFGYLELGASLDSQGEDLRSEERRVGKECRSRWSPYH